MGIAAGPTALGLSGAGAAFSALGSYNSAQGQKSALAAQAQIDQNNKQITDWQASQAIQNGQIEEGNARLRTASIYSTQRAALAANGIDLGQGSATDILTTTKLMGDRDAATVHDNALRTAWGYKTQGVNYTNNANAARAGADSISPGMAAATSLLSSAGTVASSWYGMNKAGMFPSSGLTDQQQWFAKNYPGNYG